MLDSEEITYYPLDGRPASPQGYTGKYNMNVLNNDVYMESMELLPDGSLVAVGSVHYFNPFSFHYVALRYTADHLRDWSFGRYGQFIYDDTTGVFNSVVVNNTSGFYAAGYFQDLGFCEINSASLTLISFANGIDIGELPVLRTPGFSIHPNPTHGQVIIQGDGEQDYVLYDSSGKLVKTIRHHALNEKIDLGGLPVGTYLIRGENGDVQRLVIAR